MNEDISIEGLLGKSLEILRREVTNLMMESAKGKLAASSGRDLVAYVKLLSELQEKKAEDLSEMSDEELEKVLKNVKRNKNKLSQKVD